MTQNIIFKTGECALSHLIELRLYYVKMSWIRNFMNNHNPSTMGQIQNLIYEEAKNEFTKDELKDMLFLANKVGQRTKEEAEREIDYIMRIDEVYKTVLNR